MSGDKCGYRSKVDSSDHTSHHPHGPFKQMTLLFPPENRLDRWLARRGHPRAYRVNIPVQPYGTFKAIREPMWRSLFRTRGAPPPEGWSYCFMSNESDNPNVLEGKTPIAPLFKMESTHVIDPNNRNAARAVFHHFIASIKRAFDTMKLRRDLKKMRRH